MSTASFDTQVFPSAEFVHLRGTSPSLRKMLANLGGDKLISEFSPRQEHWSAIVKHVNEHGLLGLMLTNSDKTRWGFITRDCSDNAMFRYTIFDHLGFSGHGTYATAEETCVALFDMGFREVDSPDRLAQVSNRCQWYID